MDTVILFLDWLHDLSVKTWMPNYVWATFAAFLLGWLLPDWLAVPIMLGAVYLVLYADPTNKWFGRKGDSDG